MIIDPPPGVIHRIIKASLEKYEALSVFMFNLPFFYFEVTPPKGSKIGNQDELASL